MFNFRVSLSSYAKGEKGKLVVDFRALRKESSTRAKSPSVEVFCVHQATILDISLNAISAPIQYRIPRMLGSKEVILTKLNA